MWLSLMRVSANVQRARRRRPGAAAMTLLQAVADAGPVRPSELAAHLGVTRASVTVQVRELAASGALDLAPDPQDGRSVLVAVSAAGAERLGALNERGVQRFARFTAGWDVADIRELGRLLDKLEASIAEAVRDEPPVTDAPWRRPGPANRPETDTETERSEQP
jgi:DNA-binding MarR family transcriptional regulator